MSVIRIMLLILVALAPTATPRVSALSVSNFGKFIPKTALTNPRQYSKPIKTRFNGPLTKPGISTTRKNIRRVCDSTSHWIAASVPYAPGCRQYEPETEGGIPCSAGKLKWCIPKLVSAANKCFKFCEDITSNYIPNYYPPSP